MWRSILVAALAVAVFSVPAQARLIKEMEVTRTGKLVVSGDQSGGGYTLVLDSNKTIALGDKESFGPATRQVLDQAVAQKLQVEITGHLLIFNDQSPVFALPLKSIDVKGFKTQDQSAAASPPEQPAAPAEKGDPGPFKEAFLKGTKRINLGLALEGYAYFVTKTWKVTEPGKTAEFRGEINLDDYTERDSKLFARLNSKEMRDIFRSLTFVATLTLSGNGQATSSEPYVEAVFQDGGKDKLIWKDPPNYYWDRIAANRKIKIDYFLGKAAQSSKYGKGMSN